MGRGKEGNTTGVATREETDLRLPYMLAAAALDGAQMPEQYAPERIRRPDVQDLLRRVPVQLNDGRMLTGQKADVRGCHTQPTSWSVASDKFHRPGGLFTDGAQWTHIV